MKIVTKLVFVVIALFAGIAFAESSKHLDLVKESDPNNLQAFHCTAKGIDSKVFLQNFGQMITGFSKTGQLFISPEELNKVYFQAYHDPNPQYSQLRGFVIAVTTGKGTVTCQLGKGDGDRKIMPGDFG